MRHGSLLLLALLATTALSTPLPADQIPPQSPPSNGDVNAEDLQEQSNAIFQTCMAKYTTFRNTVRENSARDGIDLPEMLMRENDLRQAKKAQWFSLCMERAHAATGVYPDRETRSARLGTGQVEEKKASSGDDAERAQNEGAAADPGREVTGGELSTAEHQFLSSGGRRRPATSVPFRVRSSSSALPSLGDGAVGRALGMGASLGAGLSLAGKMMWDASIGQAVKVPVI